MYCSGEKKNKHPEKRFFAFGGVKSFLNVTFKKHNIDKTNFNKNIINIIDQSNEFLTTVKMRSLFNTS